MSGKLFRQRAHDRWYRHPDLLLIVMLIGCGMEWFYWTYAASSLRVIDETAITSAAQAFRLAARRFLLLATGWCCSSLPYRAA